MPSIFHRFTGSPKPLIPAARRVSCVTTALESLVVSGKHQLFGPFMAGRATVPPAGSRVPAQQATVNQGVPEGIPGFHSIYFPGTLQHMNPKER